MNRIGAALRGGRVGSLADDVNLEAIHARRHGSRNGGHRTYRKLAPNVKGQSGVHLRILQNPVIDHFPGATASLLGWLKYELNGSFGDASLGEDTGGLQEHGNMCIVTTGVHPSAIIGAPGKVVLLSDGQAVHVGSEQQGLSWLIAPEEPNHTSTGARPGLDTPLFERSHYFALRPVLFKSELRMPVKLSISLDELVASSFDLRVNPHGWEFLFHLRHSFSVIFVSTQTSIY
jgi:hypothetical protein